MNSRDRADIDNRMENDHRDYLGTDDDGDDDEMADHDTIGEGKPAEGGVIRNDLFVCIKSEPQVDLDRHNFVDH